MIIEKIKKNKKGFVLLFAVTLSAILLAIALGVTNIAFNEVKFGTNAKDTNNAFFAADTGAECALIYDKNPSFSNVYPSYGIGHLNPMNCAGTNINLVGSFPIWRFNISGLGSDGLGCAKVTVDKTLQIDPRTTITSNGYNNNGDGNCTPGSNTVERQIEVKY